MPLAQIGMTLWLEWVVMMALKNSHSQRSSLFQMGPCSAQIFASMIISQPWWKFILIYPAYTPFQGFEGPVAVAMEATRGWFWLYDLLEETGAEVKLSHPLKTKALLLPG